MTIDEMTIEEAINTIISLKQYYNDKNEDSYVGFDNEDNEALDMAIRALNKEIAKKPVQPHARYSMESEYWDYYCPVCGQYLVLEPEGNIWKLQGGWSRCDNCGQKIEWSKDDDE